MHKNGSPVATEALAEGFLNIAVTHMAEAVRTVSTARGVDVRSMALVGFGGAAGPEIVLGSGVFLEPFVEPGLEFVAGGGVFFGV